jgi:hypothetical protein
MPEDIDDFDDFLREIERLACRPGAGSNKRKVSGATHAIALFRELMLLAQDLAGEICQRALDCPERSIHLFWDGNNEYQRLDSQICRFCNQWARENVANRMLLSTALTKS